MSITDEKYVRFTTFRRDGTPVSTPVWIVPVDGGRAGFWTSSASGKAKRLAANPAVTLQPCDSRGRPREGTATVDATAALVSDGPDFEAVKRRVHAKYGFMTAITKFLGNVAAFVKRKKVPYGDRAVVITLTGQASTPADSSE